MQMPWGSLAQHQLTKIMHGSVTQRLKRGEMKVFLPPALSPIFRKFLCRMQTLLFQLFHWRGVLLDILKPWQNTIKSNILEAARKIRKDTHQSKVPGKRAGVQCAGLRHPAGMPAPVQVCSAKVHPAPAFRFCLQPSIPREEKCKLLPTVCERKEVHSSGHRWFEIPNFGFTVKGKRGLWRS